MLTRTCFFLARINAANFNIGFNLFLLPSLAKRIVLSANFFNKV